MSDESLSEVVVRTRPQPRGSRRRKRTRSPAVGPRYHVVLWDDQDHTVDYVVRMLGELFARSEKDADQVAQTVHTEGRAVVLTTSLEHAELKRDQILAFGRDPLVERCRGSMSATIEEAG